MENPNPIMHVHLPLMDVMVDQSSALPSSAPAVSPQVLELEALEQTVELVLEWSVVCSRLLALITLPVAHI